MYIHMNINMYIHMHIYNNLKRIYYIILYIYYIYEHISATHCDSHTVLPNINFITILKICRINNFDVSFGQNNNKNKRKGNNIKHNYFSFPKDPQIRKIWIAKCRRADIFNTENATICDIHFDATNFEKNLQAELLNLEKFKVFLKELFLPKIYQGRKKHRPAKK